MSSKCLLIVKVINLLEEVNRISKNYIVGIAFEVERHLDVGMASIGSLEENVAEKIEYWVCDDVKLSKLALDHQQAAFTAFI